MATAPSKTRRVVWVIKRVAKVKLVAAAVWFPRRVSNKWPAIILADKRTARVPGRIIFLTVSIITINDIRAEGVPWGTKCANIELEKLTHPISVKVNQRGRASEKVVVICLVPVKINGNNPIKLFSIIIINPPKKNSEEPFKIFDPRRILTSLCRVIFTLLKIREMELGAAQNRLGAKIKGVTKPNQLRGSVIEEEGSNLENKLFIIIIYFLVFHFLGRLVVGKFVC